MTRKSGFKSWPPVWTTTRHDEKSKPVGELGTLQEVLMHDRFNTRIFLFIDFLGSRYMGSMQFDDAEFCYELYTLLKSNVRRQIKEIGDLDLSYTL